MGWSDLGSIGTLATAATGNPLAGLGISLGAGLLDSIFNSVSASSSMEKQHGYNVDMFNRQADFSREMYGRQYQDSLNVYGMQKQYADELYNRQLADQRALIADERAYNDPSRVVERLRLAGLNPKLALQSLGSTGNMSVNGVSAPSVSVPSAMSASGGSSVSPVGTYQSHLGDSLVQYAQAKNLISSADYSYGKNRREDELQPHEVISRIRDNQQKLLNQDISREDRFRLRTENSFLYERLGLQSEELKAQRQLLDAQFKVQTEQAANLAAERALMGKRFDEDVRVNNMKHYEALQSIAAIYARLAEDKRQFDKNMSFQEGKWTTESEYLKTQNASLVIDNELKNLRKKGIINDAAYQEVLNQKRNNSWAFQNFDMFTRWLGDALVGNVVKSFK